MSRLLRLLLWMSVLAGLLALGLYLGDRVQTDPGYVLFAYDGYTMEMSLWTAIIVFVACVVVAWIALGFGGLLGRAPLALWSAWGRSRHRKADGRLVEGALWLRRDQPERALSVLQTDARSESLPALHWILASEAARRLDQPDVSAEYLATAEDMMRRVPKPVIEVQPPTEFKALLKALNKNWREDWVYRLESVGDETPLTRLSALTNLVNQHKDSLALAIVEARLALAADLEAEAKHHIGRAMALNPEHPLVLALQVEVESGRSPALDELRRRIIEAGI